MATQHPIPAGTIVRFHRCGGITEAEVLGRDAQAPGSDENPRYVARSTFNRMTVAFYLPELTR